MVKGTEVRKLVRERYGAAARKAAAKPQQSSC